MRGLGLLTGLCLLSSAAAQTSTSTATVSNALPHSALLLDSMGRLTVIHTNAVENPALLPSKGLQNQIPMPLKGAKTPPEIQQRKAAALEGSPELQFFPAAQPMLASYLASQDEFGNTAARHGAFFPFMPSDPAIQKAKYWLSDQGLRYSLAQTVTGVGMTDVMKGDNALAFYTFDLQAKWTVFDSPGRGTAGWISTQIEAKTGLDAAGQTQDARRNLGSSTDPTGIWSSVNGFKMPELAWQQSLRNGELVLVGGMVSQGNYFDGNTYANSGRGQFINSGLIDSMVMPLPNYNFGLNLQWQPNDHWYGMLGSSVGNGHAGFPPWTEFSWDNWSLLGEFGYLCSDLFGLGPGIYRVQPFIGQGSGIPVETGIGLNLEQQLGHHSPFGWFGRFGTGGKERFQTGQELPRTGSQIGTGFVMQAPLKHLGLLHRLSNDLAGVGFVWSHLNESSQPIYHADEYVLETFYTLQLTPLMRFQPDFQVVWNATHNPDPGPALVAQLQVILNW